MSERVRDDSFMILDENIKAIQYYQQQPPITLIVLKNRI